MRKFLLTGEKFKGQIQLTYSSEDIIQKIDFSDAELNIHQINYFIEKFLSLLSDLEGFCKRNRFTCVESDVEITFQMFWDKYKMKVDRKRSEKIWDKLNKNKKIAAYIGIDRYERYLRRTDWRNKMEPKTYLANERWEDQW